MLFQDQQSMFIQEHVLLRKLTSTSIRLISLISQVTISGSLDMRLGHVHVDKSQPLFVHVCSPAWMILCINDIFM